MNETTLAKLLQDCAAALRGSLGLKVEVGFCREPFYQTLSQPVLALQIEEAKLSDSAFSQTVGWGKNGAAGRGDPLRDVVFAPAGGDAPGRNGV